MASGGVTTPCSPSSVTVDQRHASVIQRRYSFLANSLEPHADALAEDFFEKKIFDRPLMSRYRANSDERKRALSLLDFLSRSPKDYFLQLVEFCREKPSLSEVKEVLEEDYSNCTKAADGQEVSHNDGDASSSAVTDAIATSRDDNKVTAANLSSPQPGDHANTQPGQHLPVQEVKQRPGTAQAKSEPALSNAPANPQQVSDLGANQQPSKKQTAKPQVPQASQPVTGQTANSQATTQQPSNSQPQQQPAEEGDFTFLNVVLILYLLLTVFDYVSEQNNWPTRPFLFLSETLSGVYAQIWTN